MKLFLLFMRIIGEEKTEEIEIFPEIMVSRSVKKIGI